MFEMFLPHTVSVYYCKETTKTPFGKKRKRNLCGQRHRLFCVFTVGRPTHVTLGFSRLDTGNYVIRSFILYPNLYYVSTFGMETALNNTLIQSSKPTQHAIKFKKTLVMVKMGTEGGYKFGYKINERIK